MDTLARAVDPDEMLERLTGLERLAAARAPTHRIELYSRASVRMRVSIDDERRSPDVHLGFEDGIAARAVRLRDGSHGFAACSGTDRTALEWVVDRALRPFGRPTRSEWAEGTGHPWLDREPSSRIFDAKELSDWLDAALETAEAAGVRVRSAWVEAALTTETIAARGGLLASRYRSRVWALGLVGGRPRILGARTLEELDSATWSRSARELAPAATRAVRRQGRPVLFLPDAAASLVTALVRTVQAAGGESDPEIGPGWRLFDDPTEPRGLVGGKFDDAGFPTARKGLWVDGRRVGRIDGAGHYRRASYRDSPSPMASTLVVEPGPAGSDERAVRVEEARVHPVEASVWVLEMSGQESRDGARFRDEMLEVSPWELLRRCQGAVGEPRFLPQGIVTPAILFDSLGS